MLFVWVFFFPGPERFENPYDDMIPNILLWALLFNRRELAEILWLRGKDHLCKINIFMIFLFKTDSEIHHILLSLSLLVPNYAFFARATYMLYLSR